MPRHTQPKVILSYAGANLGQFWCISSLGTYILGLQIKKEESTYKGESQNRCKFKHFRPILSLKTSTEEWILGLPPPTLQFTTSPKPPVPMEKNRFVQLPSPNYLSSLVLDMLPVLGEYLHAKNERYWCIISRDIDDQKILQPDWMRAFCTNLRTRIFSDRGLHRKTKNRIIFHFRFLPAKSNEGVLWKVKK